MYIVVINITDMFANRSCSIGEKDIYDFTVVYALLKKFFVQYINLVIYCEIRVHNNFFEHFEKHSQCLNKQKTSMA